MARFDKNFMISMNGLTNLSEPNQEESTSPIPSYNGDNNKGIPTFDLNNINGGASSATEDPIPRPKERTPEKLREYHNALYKKYGGYSKERADWGDFVDYRLRSRPEVSIGKAVTDVATQQGLRPELLYASAMEEGFRQMFPTSKHQGVGGTEDKDYPIDGFFAFGLDTFSDQFPDLVKKGYLDEKFVERFKPVKKTNEKDEEVNSAYFKDIDDAVKAKAAVIRNAGDEINKYAEEKKIELSPKAKEFFTLVAYNAGAGNAQKMLESYNKGGYLKEDKFLEKQPTSSWTGPYQNVIKRMFMADVLKREGYFDGQPEMAANSQTAPTPKQSKSSK